MKEFDINTDERVAATDTLAGLLDRLYDAANDKLNPASDVFGGLLGELRVPVELLCQEVSRLVVIEDATRRFLDHLFAPARPGGCYGCGEYCESHKPGCPLETLETHL